MFTVICSAANGVGDNGVSLYDAREGFSVAGLRVIRVVNRGEKAVGLRHDQRTGIAANLKHFIVIRRAGRHAGAAVQDTTSGPGDGEEEVGGKDELAGAIIRRVVPRHR
jgi:hypothetical protein